jgi:hypothetical protein
VIQNVNLYQPLLRTASAPLGPRTILRLWLLFVAALALLGAFTFWTQTRTAGELRRLETDVRTVGAHLRALEARVRAHRPSPLLLAEIARARARLTTRQEALMLLTKHRYGNRHGFSTVLTDLGLAVVPGLWLTRIEIRRGGERLLLAGRATRAAEVPRYIARLLPLLRRSGDPEPRFHVLFLKRMRKRSGVFRFLVATTAPARSPAHPSRR